MSDIGGYGISRERIEYLRARRAAYAAKLRTLGIIENSNKWRTLMCRKGL